MVELDEELDSSCTRAPRIEDQGELARGGMSTIRRVRDRLVGREMAMKVLDTGIAHHELRPRFLREAQILGQLDHPHIVPLYAVGRNDDGVPCFTMKLVAGRTLAELVETTDFLASRRQLVELVDVLLKVCDAISFAHSRGVVHRDLKPENVMIGTYGQVFVMDWGIAYLLTNEQRAAVGIGDAQCVTCDRSSLDQLGTGAVIGTPAFMAPEQAWAQEDLLDARTDVFGIGGLLYFVLTGRAPHEASSDERTLELARSRAVPPPSDVAAGRALPRGLCQVAMRALDADRKRRYPSVEALRYDLERFQRGGAFETQRFPASTLIVRQHEAGDAAYIIAQGFCEAFKLEGGRKVFLRRMGPGEIFGETGLFTDQPRSASVVASSDVVALTITRADLADSLELESWVGSLVRTVAARFRDVDAQLTALRREQLKLLVRERVLTALCRGPARFSTISAALAAETGLSELDVLAIIADSDNLVLDEERDLIRFGR